jgi:ABC-type transport system involved in Fe-S cluster assembly fused permease/ATPase subunit
MNIMVMLGIYTTFTKQYSKTRQSYIRQKKNEEKQSDFFLNESIMNYETVKYFNNE